MSEGNKIILITGASFGIGEAMTRLAIKEGCSVIGIARNIKKLQELESELGKNFTAIECDVSDLNRVTEVSLELKRKKIYPSIFFLNAGTLEVELKGIEIDIQKKMFEVNYFGVINWLDLWLADCLKRNVTFVCMSSPLIIAPPPKMSGYCASKAALKTTFESLNIQYANSRVLFTTVFPGTTNTGIIQNRMKKKIPFIGEPKIAAKSIFKQILKGNKDIQTAPIRRILLRFLSFLSYTRIKKFYERVFI